VRDFAQVRAEGAITRQVADQALAMLEVDERGFDKMDRSLLLTLIDKFGGGPVGVETLAAAIGEERDTIEDVYEPFLIQEGYLSRTPKGRTATALAYEHFGRPARRGEKLHIFPYQENANVMFNSALAYELAVLKPLAEPLLRQVPYNMPQFIEARRLLAFLEWFLPLDVSLIPTNSIVREFLGGSSLQYVKIWKG
jgi:hypothetical protein